MNKKSTRFGTLLCLLFAAVLVFTGCSGRATVETELPPAGEEALSSDGFSLVLAHFNDSHANFEESLLSLTFDGITADASVGGYARLCQKAQELRQENENFLLLNAGDVFTGTPYFTQYQGSASLELLEAMQVDAMVPGNHEFDQGSPILAPFVQAASFPLVSANIDASAEPSLAGQIFPFWIIKVNGVRVGIIGLTSEETPDISRPGENLIFNDPFAAARQSVDELNTLGVKIIVALTHQGFNNDRLLAQRVNDIDIIIGGHSHTLLGDFSAVGLTSAEGPYPFIECAPNGERVLIAQAWKNAQVLGELKVRFDANGKITRYSERPILLLGEELTRKDAAGNRVALDETAWAAIARVVEEEPSLEFVAEEESCAARINELSQPLEALNDMVIARANDNLWHTRVPGTLHELAGIPLDNGSLIAHHVAKAMLWKVQSVNMREVRMAIQNAGGVRIDIPQGEITVAQAREMLPFDSTLVTLTLSGAQIEEAIADAAFRASSGDGSGAFPYAAGLRYHYNYNGGIVPQLTSIEVQEGGTWSPLDPDASYKLVTNSFLASGGDGYQVFTEATERYDTGFIDAGAFMDYAKSMGTLRVPELFNVSYSP